MDRLRRCFSRSKIALPMGITPVVKNRIRLSISDTDAYMPTDEWMAEKLDESSIFLSKTGSGKDGQLALSTLSLIRNFRHPESLTGKTAPHVAMGEVIACIDDAPHAVAICNLHWVSIDFGGNLYMGAGGCVWLWRDLIKRNVISAASSISLRNMRGYSRGVPGYPRLPPGCKQLGCNSASTSTSPPCYLLDN